MKNNKGFTLIELLAIIVILAIITVNHYQDAGICPVIEIRK